MPMLAILNQGQVEPVLKRIAIATTALLRDTLDLEPDDWLADSLLPGWSRAHVVTHVARNADALRRLISASRTGDPVPLYSSEGTKFNDIERGAERGGLDLHVDLDTSAGELARLCERVEDWMVPVRLQGDDDSLPAIDIVSDAGVTASLGTGEERRVVSGPDAALWAWLIGRTDGEGLTHSDGITFPLAG